jgi:ribosomal RNA assembly protein
VRYVRVPMQRIGVVIGPEGTTKETIERRAGVQLTIHSDTGEIEIDDHAAKDPLAPLQAEEVVKALGRGFSPAHAFKLFNDEWYLTLFDVHDYVGKNRKSVERVVGRVVGAEGRTRQLIEELTGAHVAVQGHTVGVIADLGALEAAKSAVDMLLNGSEHKSVYRFLENKRRDARRSDMDF